MPVSNRRRKITVRRFLRALWIDIFDLLTSDKMAHFLVNYGPFWGMIYSMAAFSNNWFGYAAHPRWFLVVAVLFAAWTVLQMVAEGWAKEEKIEAQEKRK